jgi:hypothetical protein
LDDYAKEQLRKRQDREVVQQPAPEEKSGGKDEAACTIA